MKVLVVGTGGSIVSGITTAADEMAQTLPDFGHVAERLNAGERRRRRANAINLENLGAVLGDAAAVARRARRGGADVVWIHTFGVPILPALRALAMVAAARVAGRPAVVHLHAFGLERSLARGGRWLRVAVRVLVALAHAVVVLHEEAAAALAEVTGTRSAHVVHNWVEVPDVAAPLPPHPGLRLVFVGGLVRRKGVVELIEAMRAVADDAIELRLVGGPGEDGEAALARLQEGAADLVVAGRVAFVGELDAPGVRDELRAAHLLVLPSQAEGTPIAMLEAMAEGRPVLVTDAGNMRSVVEQSGCGWVLPDRRPATIATWARRIAEDPAGLAQASARARHTAATRYSPRARGHQLDTILASLPR